MPLIKELLSNGAANSWAFEHMGDLIINQNYEANFFLAHFLKDLDLAQNTSDDDNFPALHLAHQICEEISAQGNGQFGFHSMYKWYERTENREPRTEEEFDA